MKKETEVYGTKCKCLTFAQNHNHVGPKLNLRKEGTNVILENVATANALQLEAAQAMPAFPTLIMTPCQV